MVAYQEVEKLSEYLAGFSKLPMTSIKPESELIGLAKVLPRQEYMLGGTIRTKTRINQDSGNIATTSDNGNNIRPYSSVVMPRATGGGWDLGEVLNIPKDLFSLWATKLQFWKSQEELGEKALDVLPIFIVQDGEKITFGEFGRQVIDYQKETSEKLEEEWEKSQLQAGVENFINFKFPSLKGIGKWLLIGGAALAGIYLVGKLLGRKK
jgi:hypothetical protein